MPFCHRLVPLLAALGLALAAATGAHADEQTAPATEPSLLERYTNTAQDLILKSLELVGINYRFGGADPDSGLDCSGLVQVVFRDAAGLFLPRTAREQSQVGERVDVKDLQPGDLVFFNTMRHAFSHVGIYIGDGKFIHSPRSGEQVRVEDMGTRYWRLRFNGARRVADQALGGDALRANTAIR